MSGVLIHRESWDTKTHTHTHTQGERHVKMKAETEGRLLKPRNAKDCQKTPRN